MFYEGTELRQSLHNDHLKYVPDLHRLSKRFQRGIATLQVMFIVSFILSLISFCFYVKDVVRIHQVILRLPAILLCLESNKPENEKQASLLYATYTANIRVSKIDDLKLVIHHHGHHRNMPRT